MNNNNNSLINNLIDMPDAMNNLYQIDIIYNKNGSEGIHTKNNSSIKDTPSRPYVLKATDIDNILKKASYRVNNIIIPPQSAPEVNIPFKGLLFKKVAPGSNLDKILTLPLRLDQNFELYSLFQAACPVDINGSIDNYFGDINIEKIIPGVDSILPSFEVIVSLLKPKINSNSSPKDDIEAFSESNEDTNYKVVFKWHFHDCIVSSIESFTLSYESSNALTANVKLIYSYVTAQSFETSQDKLNQARRYFEEKYESKWNKIALESQARLEDGKVKMKANEEKEKKLASDRQKLSKQISKIPDLRDLYSDFYDEKTGIYNIPSHEISFAQAEINSIIANNVSLLKGKYENKWDKLNKESNNRIESIKQQQAQQQQTAEWIKQEEANQLEKYEHDKEVVSSQISKYKDLSELYSDFYNKNTNKYDIPISEIDYIKEEVESVSNKKEQRFWKHINNGIKDLQFTDLDKKVTQLKQKRAWEEFTKDFPKLNELGDDQLSSSYNYQQSLVNKMKERKDFQKKVAVEVFGFDESANLPSITNSNISDTEIINNLLKIKSTENKPANKPISNLSLSKKSPTFQKYSTGFLPKKEIKPKE